MGRRLVARNTVYAAVGITSFTNGFVLAFRPNAGGVGGGGGGIDLPSVGGPLVLAGPGAFAAGYATPLATTPKGGRLSFTSLDLPQHDVVAVADGPGCGTALEFIDTILHRMNLGGSELARELRLHKTFRKLW